MKIFITTGTTGFPELVEFVDKVEFFGEHDVWLQVGPGREKSIKYRSDYFIEVIDEAYKWADVVVTHAGAGTIFDLLDREKDMVVVPNPFRIDLHQFEIANWLARNKFCAVAKNLSDLPALICRSRQGRERNFDVVRATELWSMRQVVMSAVLDN